MITEYDEYDVADAERAATARRQNAEQLADRWIEDGHRVFAEWLSGRLDDTEIARLFGGSFPLLKRLELRDEFVDFILRGRFK